MRKLFIVLLFAASVSFSSFGGGCSAQPQNAGYAIYCTGNQGRCSVFVAIGSGETSECISTYSTATCNKYDEYGGLIVSKFEYCIDYWVP